MFNMLGRPLIMLSQVGKRDSYESPPLGEAYTNISLVSQGAQNHCDSQPIWNKTHGQPRTPSRRRGSSLLLSCTSMGIST